MDQGKESKSFLDTKGVMAALSALEKKTEDVSPLTPDPSEMMRNDVMRLLLKKMQQEDKESEEKKESARKLQKEGALAMERSRQDQIAAQGSCSHLKDNGKSRVVGQRDHKHNSVFICQACQKEWKNDIPSYLLPPLDYVGGPNQ